MYVRTQIQLSAEQARALKQMANREGKSVSELIRMSVEMMLRSGGIKDQEALRKKAIAAVGKFDTGPADLSAQHDKYLAEAFDQ
jgi:hypothetical protein